MTKKEGSGSASGSESGSISQRHGSADPDYLDSHQNVMDSQQWYKAFSSQFARCSQKLNYERVLTEDMICSKYWYPYSSACEVRTKSLSYGNRVHGMSVAHVIVLMLQLNKILYRKAIHQKSVT
jgi:hypothetical protein